MSYGKPLIVTSGDCMKDYTDPAYTLEVKAGSTDDLKKALFTLENNPELNRQMGFNSLRAYEKCFTIDKYAERICRIILN